MLLHLHAAGTSGLISRCMCPIVQLLCCLPAYFHSRRLSVRRLAITICDCDQRKSIPDRRLVFDMSGLSHVRRAKRVDESADASFKKSMPKAPYDIA